MTKTATITMKAAANGDRFWLIERKHEVLGVVLEDDRTLGFYPTLRSARAAAKKLLSAGTRFQITKNGAIVLNGRV